MIFLGFLGPDTQIEGRQNTVSTVWKDCSKGSINHFLKIFFPKITNCAFLSGLYKE